MFCLKRHRFMIPEKSNMKIIKIQAIQNMQLQLRALKYYFVFNLCKSTAPPPYVKHALVSHSVRLTGTVTSIFRKYLFCVEGNFEYHKMLIYFIIFLFVPLALLTVLPFICTRLQNFTAIYI